MTRTAAGDREAFARLYRLTAPKLFAVAVRIVKRRDWAEEILQESFVNIWNHAREYRPDKGAVITWMASIVRHRALDWRRSPASQEWVNDENVVASQPDQAPGPMDQLLVSNDARMVRDCLDKLDAQQRQAIMFAFFHGLTHMELSKRLRAPLGTVKTWIRRGLERIRSCLEA